MPDWRHRTKGYYCSMSSWHTCGRLWSRQRAAPLSARSRIWHPERCSGMRRVNSSGSRNARGSPSTDSRIPTTDPSWVATGQRRSDCDVVI